MKNSPSPIFRGARPRSFWSLQLMTSSGFSSECSASAWSWLGLEYFCPHRVGHSSSSGASFDGRGFVLVRGVYELTIANCPARNLPALIRVSIFHVPSPSGHRDQPETSLRKLPRSPTRSAPPRRTPAVSTVLDVMDNHCGFYAAFQGAGFCWRFGW